LRIEELYDCPFHCYLHSLIPYMDLLHEIRNQPTGIMSYFIRALLMPNFMGHRYSVVGIATGCGLDDTRGRSSSPGKVKNFLFSTSSRPVLGSTQPPIQWLPGTLSPWVKRQGREADNSPQSGAQVKKMWIYTSTPTYAFMKYCLISYVLFRSSCI
jgi:hypothetical protein